MKFIFIRIDDFVVTMALYGSKSDCRLDLIPNRKFVSTRKKWKRKC